MRMNYKTYPTDYVQELKAKGRRGRKKAQAFLDYYDDIEHSNYNSERFYADAWGISPSTAHLWLKEFRYEIDLFLNHWKLKNQQHYNKTLYDEQIQDESLDNSVKISIEQIEQTQSSKSSEDKILNLGKTDNTIEQNEEYESSEVFNNNTTTTSDHLTDRNFNELLFIYRSNGGNSQNTQETYKAYKESLREVKDVGLLKVALVKYLHDSDLDNKVWFKRFLEEKIYQKYLKPHYTLKTLDGKEIAGTYNEIEEKFYTDEFQIP